MVAQSKMTKYPFYRFGVGVRANFQGFVIVGEHRGFHNMTVHEREEIGDGKCHCIRAFLGVSVAVMSKYGAESARHLGPPPRKGKLFLQAPLCPRPRLGYTSTPRPRPQE